jgi:endonuclease/exonuclease/phosphatase family metal-dependent hydrolase
VLGDFNRRWTSARDWFFDELDDASPPEADLDSPTRAQTLTCWTQALPSVDHLVLSRELHARVLPGSFEMLRFRAADLPYRAQLSDHCPILLGLGFD